jgi:hypothetical protein
MQLAQFAAECLREGCFQGCDLDGGWLQDRAAALGLIIRTKYDPAIHGESDGAEPGDDWWIFSDELKTALAEKE